MQVPDLMNDVMYQNQNLFRGLPLAAGGFGFVSLLANRILSGVRHTDAGQHSGCGCSLIGNIFIAMTLNISMCKSASRIIALSWPDVATSTQLRYIPLQIAPVVDASSSQSRADVLGIVLSAVLLLTGLQWASLKAKPLAAVALDGTEVMFTEPDAKLPSAAAKEMAWAWESLRANSRCR
jgi:hypothetical protein